jgi:hypothetical protein
MEYSAPAHERTSFGRRGKRGNETNEKTKPIVRLPPPGLRVSFRETAGSVRTTNKEPKTNDYLRQMKKLCNFSTTTKIEQRTPGAHGKESCKRLEESDDSSTCVGLFSKKIHEEICKTARAIGNS